VLAVSGALLVLDAVATLVWQEPISSAFAWWGQSGLERELAGAAGRDGDLAASAAAWARRVERGDAIGRISMPTLRRSFVMVQGVGSSALRKGPATTPTHPSRASGARSRSPGTERPTWRPSGRSTGSAAGSASCSRCPRATQLPVEKTRIVPPTATEVIRREGYDRLVLTPCHPLYSAAERIVVFARLTQTEALGLARVGGPLPGARGTARARLV
jgi:sortase A